jgi:hypothetical protein
MKGSGALGHPEGMPMRFSCGVSESGWDPANIA